MIGEVTATGRLVAALARRAVAELPIAPLTDGAPRYDRPRREAGRPRGALGAGPWRDPPTRDVAETLLALLAARPSPARSGSTGSTTTRCAWATVVGPGGDAAVVRIEDEAAARGWPRPPTATRASASSIPSRARGWPWPRCCRNLAAVGAEPLGLTDCLNFGNPEKPEIMWQLAEAIRGLGDACRALEVPVVSGNVSLYNETDGRAIQPTPAVAVVGLVDGRRAHDGRAGFARPGDRIALLGALARRPATGRQRASAALAGLARGRPPKLDLALEKTVQAACRLLVRAGLLRSAHDCSDGGLAVALAECCMMGAARQRLGAAVALPVIAGRAELALFSEEPSRIVISFGPEREAEVLALCRTAGAPLLVLGSVGGDELVIEGHCRVPVTALSEAWRGGLPAVLGKV